MSLREGLGALSLKLNAVRVVSLERTEIAGGWQERKWRGRHKPTRKQRSCLSHEDRGNTRQRQCLS